MSKDESDQLDWLNELEADADYLTFLCQEGVIETMRSFGVISMETFEDTRTKTVSTSRTESLLDKYVVLLTTLITEVGSVWFLILALEVIGGPPIIQGFPQSDPRYGVWIQGVQFNQIIVSLSITALGLTLRGGWQTLRFFWKHYR